MTRRFAAVAVCLVAAISLAGCKEKDAGQCDFYHSLGAGYMQSQGFVPADVQNEIDTYC